MDLLGWDAAFVASLDAFNRALATAKDAVVKSFSFSEDGVSASGTFGAWSIVPGGSGQLLDVCLPVVAGQLIPAPGKPAINLASRRIVLRLPLRWLERQDAQQTRELAFDLRKVSQQANPDPSAVSLVSVSPTDGLTPMQATILGNAIATYVSAHTSDVSFVFAGINPLTLGSAKLRPVTTAYVYLDTAGNASPALAILCAVTARNVAADPRIVDATLRPAADANATMVIAGTQLMRYAIAPAIATGLGVGSDRLVTDDDGRISLTGAVNDITSVSASLKDARLSVSWQGSTSEDLGKGITMNFSITCEFALAAVLPALSLSFKKLTVTNTKTIEKTWWLKWLEAMGGESAQQGIELVLQKMSDDLVNKLQQQLTSIGSVDLSWVIPSGGLKLSPASSQVANALIVRGTLA